jgi:formylglycine-generating enzyme required for sulfatase activity
MSDSIHTGGGAHVGEGVNTGGDFIGRDQIIENQNIYITESVTALLRALRTSPPTQEALQRATEDYYQALVSRHRYLSLKGMGVSDRVPLKLPLLDLYVPLRARLELPEGETWRREALLAGRRMTATDAEGLIGRLSEPTPVLDLLTRHDGLIILGDPGAGKTTFLKFLALHLALGQGPSLGIGTRFPVLAPLSAYANALDKDDVRLDDFVAQHLRDSGADLPIREMLDAALKGGTALVLLDGLDEIKNPALRNTVVERLVDFYTFHRRAGNKFVITSRVVGYREVRPTAEGLAECTLVDFDDDEIAAFVERWTVALERQAQGDTNIAASDAARERQDLLEAIGRNPSVRRLAANPLLLTILALMKRQGVTLPERRVELYDQYVRTLLSTWNRTRGLGRPPSRDLDVVQTVRILAPLALWMHEMSPGVGLVKREEVRRKLEGIYQERGETRWEDAARQFLEDVREHAGLLLERGPGEYGFIHLTFEEYLAAVAIALQGQGNCRPILNHLAQHVGDPAWREVALLTVGYLGIIQQLDRVAGDVVDALATEKPGKPGEAAVLAGEAVLDAWPEGVPPSSKDRVVDVLAPTMQDAAVPAVLRRQAGLLLGRLGWLPADLDAFVEAPAGAFLYGDNKKTREIPYRFWIGKYPVTNAQYARFMADGGYDRRELWSEGGWVWRQGGEADLSAIDDGVLKDTYESWLAGRPAAMRGEPFFWHDVERNNPICPAVGITWYEAEAYVHWLNRRRAELDLGEAFPPNYVVRLPLEAEWERAARGSDGREYPWGDEFDFARANVAEEMGKGNGTTAVCTYPLGAGPTGACDMSGNVWEWTSSPWSAEGNRLVVRGGSWGDSQRLARCAFRFRYGPVDFLVILGFRVVVSLSDPGF